MYIQDVCAQKVVRRRRCRYNRSISFVRALPVLIKREYSDEFSGPAADV